MLKLGIVGTSRKENERRLPIHPAHFDLIPARVRQNLTFERGYAAGLGVTDDQLTRRFGGVMSREELLAQNDVALLPKPSPEDLLQQPEGAVLWGWPHCVQQMGITQAAIAGWLQK